VYILDKVVHRREHTEWEPKTRCSDESDEDYESRRKHVRLLDLIALLLVSETTSDVAATSFHLSSDQVTIYFAKNRPCTFEELHFANTLRDILMGLRGAGKIGDADYLSGGVIAVLHLAASHCRSKILHRLAQLRQLLKKNPDLGFWFKEPSMEVAHKLWNRLPEEQQKMTSDFTTSMGVIAVVRDWIEFATAFKDSDIDDPSDIQWLCSISYWMTGEVAKSENGLFTDTGRDLQTVISKLGDYFAAANKLVNTVAWIVTKEQPIYIVEVLASPAPESSTLGGVDALTLLNRWAVNHRRPMMTTERIMAAYPNVQERSLVRHDIAITVVNHGMAGVPSKPVVIKNACCHAECTIAMFLLRSVRPPTLRDEGGFIEVGISKSACWLCQKFFELLREHTNINVLYSTNHGKIYSGWRCPGSDGTVEDDKLAATLYTKMEILLDDEINTIFNIVEKRRRRDSDPALASGDECALPKVVSYGKRGKDAGRVLLMKYAPPIIGDNLR
jgi:hypothetical protein